MIGGIKFASAGLLLAVSASLHPAYAQDLSEGTYTFNNGTRIGVISVSGSAPHQSIILNTRQHADINVLCHWHGTSSTTSSFDIPANYDGTNPIVGHSSHCEMIPDIAVPCEIECRMSDNAATTSFRSVGKDKISVRGMGMVNYVFDRTVPVVGTQVVSGNLSFDDHGSVSLKESK